MGTGITKNLKWFVFATSALFSKKRGNHFLKISTINLHRAGKLKRGEKDRHISLTK